MASTMSLSGMENHSQTQTLACNGDIWREMLNCTVILQLQLLSGLMMMVMMTNLNSVLNINHRDVMSFSENFRSNFSQ